MAKTSIPVEAVQQTDVNPDVAFRDAWKANKNAIREILTRDHQIRSGLRPSQIEKGKNILAEYGL